MDCSIIDISTAFLNALKAPFRYYLLSTRQVRLRYIPKKARPYFVPVKIMMPASIHLMVRAGTNF